MVMEQRLSQSFLVIEKVIRAEHPQGVDNREFVARVPFETGTHLTDKGVLGVVFHAPDAKNRSKVILTGDVVPTVQKRGKKNQFRQPESPRRVVEFPMVPGGMTRQEISPREYLLFRREEIIL